MDRPLIMYHANCPDGFTAAWCAYRKLGPNCDFVPAHYGEPPPDVRGRDVIILDFSYRRPVMVQIMNDARSLVVLDHHKTAEAELADLGDLSDEISMPRPCFIFFDMNKSGARLAWEHFFRDKEVPRLVRYVEDRDLWRWHLPFSRSVNAAISSYPFCFHEWTALFVRLNDNEQRDVLITEGAAIERYKSQQVENICQHASEIEMDGHQILAVNTTVQFSEVAGKLAEGRPFGAAWFERSDGKRQWSLRSRDGGIDVSEVAKRRGGGGHWNAAGFEEG